MWLELARGNSRRIFENLKIKFHETRLVARNIVESKSFGGGKKIFVDRMWKISRNLEILRDFYARPSASFIFRISGIELTGSGGTIKKCGRVVKERNGERKKNGAEGEWKKRKRREGDGGDGTGPWKNQP